MDTIKIITSTNTATNVIDKWQSSKKTIKARFSFLFNNEKLSDIHFIVGKNKQHRIPAHKLVLAAASDIFEAMFFGYLPNESDQVELPDIEPTIFLAFLKFIYTDELKIDHETVMSTLYVAKKYNLTVLKDYCVDYLQTNLDCDHAVLLLRQARFFDEPELADKCLDYIDQNANEALVNNHFIEMDLDTLTVLLKRDTLKIEETKLYEAILRWTEAECARKQLPLSPENQRFVLGPTIQLIRFPLMSIEEFANGPVQSGLLTDREVKELMLNITANPKSVVARCCEQSIREEQILNRFTRNNVWFEPGFFVDSIDLMVDRSIFIVGFGLYGYVNKYINSVVFDVDLQLQHKDTNTVCGSTQTSFNCDDRSTKIYKVRFKEPIQITPNKYYRASVKIKVKNNPDTDEIRTWGGSGGKNNVIINDLNGKPITFQFANTRIGCYTNVRRGQIPEIIFYS